MLSYERCQLEGFAPSMLDETPEITSTGWGSYGDDSEAADSYRYLCDFWADGRYAGTLQLIQASDPATADQTLQLFLSQTDTDVQDNTVTTVQAEEVEVHVLKRWYPTNPQGQYEAMYVDTENNAIVVLEVNSLDETDFAEYSEEEIAEDLVSALASAS